MSILSRHDVKRYPVTLNDPLPTPRKRRVRYAGTHPRRFAEKYKEHNPERYAADVQKVIARGKTPAGMHRPICLREVIEILSPQPGETAVDATLGYGAHALELLRAIQPGGRLIGLDVDPIEFPKTEARLRAAGFPPESLVVRRTNFAGLLPVLTAEGIGGADMILADLGVSSMQIDNPDRGFSFKQEGPLDLRLNPQHGRPVSAFVATVSEPDLAALLSENADEPHASNIAHAICAARSKQPIVRTIALANIIRDALSKLRRSREDEDASVRRVFQALRIAVNDEFGALESFLRHLPDCLKAGARVAILTFHSGEDRRVKKAFQNGERSGIYARVARDVIRPAAEEIRSNPRAASAKLRWAVRA